MLALSIIAQIIIAVGIVNVWLVRSDRPTAYRPEGAANLQEEFRKYGFPNWVRKCVGFAKLTLAALLLVGILVPAVTGVAAAGMTSLMLAAILAHVRVSDPAIKAVPAFSMLVLSSFVLYANGLPS